MSDELDDIAENLSEPSAWVRILFMIGFAIGLYLIIVPIVGLLALVQALFSVFGGAPNDNLRRFGTALTLYIGEILAFLFYNRQEKPFPFSDFPVPERDDDDAPAEKAAKSAVEPKPIPGARKPAAGRAATKKSPAKKTAAKKKSGGGKKAAKKSAAGKTGDRADVKAAGKGDEPAGTGKAAGREGAPAANDKPEAAKTAGKDDAPGADK